MLRLVLTAGEPAGIGPELLVQIAQQDLPKKFNSLTQRPVQLVAVCDPALLHQAANALDLPLTLGSDSTPSGNSVINVLPTPLMAPVEFGQLNTANAPYVLKTLEMAANACLTQQAHALVTAPVHKGVINDAGIAFSGHTEFFAECAGRERVVMMLATEGLRVALATTHLPLKDVSAAITQQSLTQVIQILHRDLVHQFGLTNPTILVCGLNPHAGEGGHLGREEIDIIEPVLAQLKAQGLNLLGPLPADTLFTPHHLEKADAVLAMYHDQGLPVLKYKGFGNAVNITLGLPFIRTSVDHGTALDLAGTGSANTGSLHTAIKQAIIMAEASTKT